MAAGARVGPILSRGDELKVLLLTVVMLVLMLILAGLAQDIYTRLDRLDSHTGLQHCTSPLPFVTNCPEGAK